MCAARPRSSVESEPWLLAMRKTAPRCAARCRLRRELILLVCSPDCAMTVSAELESNGSSFRMTDPSVTSAILRSATVLGVVEGWLIANRRWYAFFDGTLARQRMRSILEVTAQ